MLNATMLARAPEAVAQVNRMLEPAMRGTLSAAERARLTELIAVGLHNGWVAVALSALILLLVAHLPARLSPLQQRLR